MRGRPANPLEKAIARGTEGAAERAATAPPRVAGLPSPPEWFGADEMTCWIDVGMLLQARGQLSQDSGPSLVALCQCYGEWVALARDIRDDGRSYWATTTTGEHVEKARPQVGMLADADRRLRAWLTEFGLTDASRGKAPIAPEAPKGTDPLAAYGLH